MMMYRTVKNAIVTLLDDNAFGHYRVIGRQRQSRASDEIKDNDRTVQVYYSDGSFPKNAGRMIGTKSHDLTIDIDLAASASAQGDLSILDSDLATPIQKAAAIAAIKEASENADEKIDELIDYVYNILMDARNAGLGLDNGEISSRWIDRIQKDTLLERGDLIVKTANMKYTCRVQETVGGAIGFEPSTVIFDSETPVDGASSTGITVENDNL